MSGPEFGPGPSFSGSLGSHMRPGGSRGEGYESGGPHTSHGRSNFPESWGGMEREHSWGSDAPSSWGPRDSSLMPPGNIIAGRGPPSFGDGRGRGGFGRGPDFGPRGRGPGGFGRGRWNSDGDFEGRPFEGRNFEGRGFRDGQMMGERGFGPRGGMRGRGDFRGGRGGLPHFGGRYGGFEGRGRRDGWGEDDRSEPDIDPALLERRRESSAALLKRQVSLFQVSRDLIADEEVAEEFSKIMESSGEAEQRADVRTLYIYPMFSAEEMGTVPTLLHPPSDQSAAFEQCLQMYQDAQIGHTLVQSEHGNFLMPA